MLKVHAIAGPREFQSIASDYDSLFSNSEILMKRIRRSLEIKKEYIEKDFIEFKLNKNAWNVSKTAEELDIQRSHLYNKIDKFDLERNN